MTLADAIRKGAMQREQGFCLLFQEVAGVVVTCAMGAAYEGVFGGRPAVAHRAGDELRGVFPELRVDRTARWVRCPACSRRNTLWTIIGDCLNDEHRWTREQIADWLDTLETPSSTPDAAPPAERGEV